MLVDQEHRIRIDRIDNKKSVIYRVKDWNVREVLVSSLTGLFYWTRTWSRRTIKLRTAGGKSDLDLEGNDKLLM